MSRAKILKNIKKNLPKKVELKDIEFEAITYKNPLEEFIQNFLLSGGELTDTPKGVVLKARYGIAENGACILEEVEDRKKYSFDEEIIIMIDKNNILDNMHQAYEKLTIEDFLLIMAGPSKTADIEQSLVIGAHGAKKVYIFIV